MATNPKIFKAYDIRGIYGQDLDEDTAYKLGRAYADLRREELDKETPRIVVGYDMRLSSPQLKEALTKGLLDGGCDVEDIGLVSTPTFYYGVANFGYDGGIIVSASHNPAEYNGFKLTRDKAVPISGETGIATLKDSVVKGEFSTPAQVGKLTKRDDILNSEIEADLKFANLANIKNLKIVVDTANGMGAQYLEPLFNNLPCELIKLNFTLDGSFPAHEADPLKEENMRQLQDKIKEVGADLGISTDGDGDRVFFVDNLGKTIEQSIIRGILAKLFLRDWPGAKICYDIRPGKITYDLIKENGGIPIVTRVGHSLIKEQALKEGAYFAGESSGHFFLNLSMGCFEMPNIMILKLLEELSVSGKTAAEYIKPYQKYFHSGEINSVVSDKEAVFKKLEETYADANINKLDGITIEYPDFWFNVRGSNTEPKMRLNLEAVNPEIMEQKRDEVLNIIRS
jgi:phosphomannomutase